MNPGLTSEDVRSRRDRGLGHSEPPATTRSYAQILRANIVTRFNAILAVLLGIIIVIGPFQDGLFGVVLITNTALGIIQEVRTKLVLDRLAVLSVPHARVRRDGQAVEMALADLVVDDVIELRRGDQVPLDGTVIEGSLELDESLLSGEADPVVAAADGPVLSGSFVVAGTAAYRVERVGADSYAQRLAGDARRFTLASSELRDGVDRFLQIIQWALLPAAILLITSQLRGNADLTDSVRGSVAGVSAMIPEGLILLTTVAFGVAVVRLVRKRVLVQELPAVEGLARVDVICLDKTGTLTHGGMAVAGVEHLGALTDDEVGAALGALAAVELDPNPTLAAIGARWAAPDGWVAEHTQPFSSARRWSGADFGAKGVWVLGAPEAVMGQASTAHTRTVALASTTVLGDSLGATTPVALVRLTEDIRDDAAPTLAYFRDQGVAVKIISGDNPGTVATIAALVGVDGADDPVDASGVDDAELARLVHERSVFGRVSPQQKRAMVQALQGAGHTVAMTGDGVNDVLALKDADIAIAMGSGSAVTRGVAQLILLDDDFSVLPGVIAEGRRVLANVERVANLFLVKTVYALVIALMVGITGYAYPFLPRHLTIIDDFTIGVPAFFLALLPNATPFRKGFVGRVLRFTIPCGAVVGAAASVAYLLAHHAHRSLEVQRTMTTIVIACCGLWVLSLLARPWDRARTALVVAVSAGFAGVLAISQFRHFFALHIPPATQAAEMAGLVLVSGVLLEIVARRQAAGSS